MKILLFGFGVLFVTLFIGFSDKGNLANAGDCGSISNSDDKYHCKAVESNRASGCDYIGNSDKQRYCRGVVNKQSSECDAVSDSVIRGKCRRESK